MKYQDMTIEQKTAYKKRATEYQKNRLHSDPLEYKKQLLRVIKYRCGKKGIPFDVTVEDIDWVEVCPVFGWELVYAPSNGKKVRYQPSVDKIVPSLGYVKGNIQVLSHLANSMKQDASQEELELFAKWVL